MYCFTSKDALAVLAVVFGLEGGLPLPGVPGGGQASEPAQLEQALPQDAQFLEIESNGYSRFEIEGDEIVARFSGGVEFKYMGYAGAAEELIYHHGTQQAMAMGDVRFELGEIQLSSTQAQLDVAAGTAALGEPVYARLKGRGIFLEAQSAAIEFTPGQPPETLADVRAELAGGVSAYSTLGSWLQTDSVRLDGASGELTTGGAFTIALSSEQLQKTQARAGVQWGAVRISGKQAALTFEENGLLKRAKIDGLDLTTDLGSLAGETATVARLDDEQGPQWQVDLTGEPLSGEYSSPQQTVALVCRSISARFLPGGDVDGRCAGEVEIKTEAQRFTGEDIAFSIADGGVWHVSVPQEFSLGFRLADEPMELGQLPGAGEG